MTTFTQLPLHLPILLSRSLTGCGWPWPPTWPASRAPPASTRNLISAVTWPGAPSEAWTRWPPGGPHLELYIRWMQEIRRFKPSTTSRRFSVTAGFYRSSVIDGVMQPSPVEHVRRPGVPAESPTLGFTHLQFEALLTASRESPNPSDFVLLAAGAAAVITLSWLVPYPVVAATNSQGAARVTPRLVDLVAALAAGRWARPWPAPPIARRRRASRRYASACSGSRPTCGPLPSTPTTLCSAASGAIAWAAILKFVRCARVVVGSLRRSSALPPSAIMIRMLSLLTRSSG